MVWLLDGKYHLLWHKFKNQIVSIFICNILCLLSKSNNTRDLHN